MNKPLLWFGLICMIAVLVMLLTQTVRAVLTPMEVQTVRLHELILNEMPIESAFNSHAKIFNNLTSEHGYPQILSISQYMKSNSSWNYDSN